MNYPVLKLKPKREKSVLQKHPWIFSGGLDNKPKANDGDIVEVRSAGGEVLGYGFYSEKSQISCRMFHWGESEDFESVHYWQGKIERALALRKTFIDLNTTNCYRLIHAEGDFLPGIIADVYNTVVVIQILIKAIENRKDLLVKALNNAGFPNIYLKSKTSSQRIEDVVTASGFLSGEATSPVIIRENNLQFKVDFIEGQKTGFFLDQRDNRNLVKQFSAGKTVLNAFSYSGGFSVYALAAGAKEVHSVDISAEAIKMAEENAALNQQTESHKGIAEDCFEFLKNMPSDYYDVIVLDPPAFAKHARAVENASRGYKQINMRAFQKIKKNGILFTYSCSQNISEDLFQKIVFAAAADVGRNVRIIYQLHQPPDHPINIYHPEGEYLKGLALWVE
ncbi:MAG TPA: class I SAM-dependent rRNA methyltransferase [Cytophagaceae bacterium]